ncbi:hypothetical protein [Sulfurimonas sp. RIFOXYB12_FULL_35_9]|uniref:hypothetical protein n=1 Tax=Sulfurimonas sp. RIFOXYB12_FULL_35_9 TaxID=1802256 RepID=UPI0008C7B09D|nr:hypothetical protein [Sulfurimonas sp. RIFOXYB12_FULL_35_9]MBS4069654.1 hypothetical protein [Sulfurimonas sp.]OHE04993.1 MAG: hypothetical protein A2345_11100 [Sulfurimonas sp. RIFOXYB12_FULL_35_9]
MIPNVNPSAIVNNEAIFIWLDILGFSEALEDFNAYKELHALLNSFEIFFLTDKGYDLQVISDGIILKITSKELSELREIFEEIAIKQFQFILKEKYFIRGGIAVGNHFDTKDKEKLFMGNGLSRAVKLEGKVVHHAVIGTNNETIKRMRLICELEIENDELFGLKKTVNENGETLYFIDFLEQNIDFENMLHGQIGKNQIKPQIQKKYLWIYRYYINKFGSTYRPFDDVLGVLL